MLVAVVVYLPGLNGGPILDDVTNFEPLADYLKGKLTLAEVVFQNSSGPSGRPLSFLTFALNYASTGDLLWPLKATNLAFHLVCGLLIYQLGVLLFEQNEAVRSHAKPAALVVSALWLLSPIQVSAVLYIVQRMAQLSTVFCLFGMLLYVKGRSSTELNFSSKAARILVSMFVCTPLAFYSKENGAILPFLLLLIEICFFRFSGDQRMARALKIMFFVWVAIPAGISLFVLAGRPDLLLDGYSRRDFTLFERILSEARILWGYIYDLLLPRTQQLGVFHDDFFVSRSLIDPPTTGLACAAWVLVIVAMIRGLRSRNRIVWFGPAVFLASHAIESTFLPLELVFEHRNYLAAFGIYFGIVFWALVYWPRRQILRRVPLLVAVAIPFLFAVSTMQRSLTWRDIGTMLLSAEKSHPNSPRLHAEIAGYSMAHGDLAEALSHLDKVAKIKPELSVAVQMHKELARCLAGIQDHAMEPSDWGAGNLLPSHPYTVSVMTALAMANDQQRCDAHRFGQVVVRVFDLYKKSGDPGGWLFNFTMGRLLQQTGDNAAAFAFWSIADGIDSSRLEPSLMRARILMDLGDWRAADAVVEDLKHRDQGKVKAHTKLIAQYDELIQTHQALR